MASLINRVSDFARSKQGRSLLDKAKGAIGGDPSSRGRKGARGGRGSARRRGRGRAR